MHLSLDYADAVLEQMAPDSDRVGEEQIIIVSRRSEGENRTPLRVRRGG